jgi:hypothetical protein
MLSSERLGVFAQKALDEIRREIGDLVASDILLDEAQLFQMSTTGYLLVTETLEDAIEICGESTSKIEP